MPEKTKADGWSSWLFLKAGMGSLSLFFLAAAYIILPLPYAAQLGLSFCAGLIAHATTAWLVDFSRQRFGWPDIKWGSLRQKLMFFALTLALLVFAKWFDPVLPVQFLVFVAGLGSLWCFRLCVNVANKVSAVGWHALFWGSDDGAPLPEPSSVFLPDDAPLVSEQAPVPADDEAPVVEPGVA